MYSKTNEWGLYKRRKGHTDADGHVTREAEVEVISLEAEEPQGQLANANT